MSIFPMIDPGAGQGAQAQTLPLCKEVAWDFEHDVPIFRGGVPVVVTGKDALKVWIWRALRTPRFKYEIYTWAYGSEFETLLGQAYSEALKTAEAPRYLRECLLVNPYITAVKDVQTEFAGTVLSISGTAETIYGEVPFDAHFFENQTPEAILGRVLGRMNTDLQTREGSYAYDQAAPMALEVSGVYQSMEELVDAFYVNQYSGKYLDAHGDIFDLTRREGVRAQAELTVTGRDGVAVPAGAAFFTQGGLEFRLLEDVVVEDGEGRGVLQAAEPGERYNVPAGEVCRMLRTIAGLDSFAAGEAEGGADPESDEALFRRIDDRRRHPPASGNPSYYRMLAMEVDGVGNAKVERVWAGPGTCRVLIAGYDHGPVEQAVVDAVARHIEPKRVVGAEVTVASVTGTAIGVAVHLVLDSSTTRAQARAELVSRLGTYLQELAFEEYTVYASRVGALIMSIGGVVDYSGLTLNGGAGNVEIAADAVPVPGEVELV